MGKIIHIADAGKGDKIAAVDAMTKSLQSHLNGIAAHFDHPLITLIVRTEKGGDLIMTNDTTGNAVEALWSNKSTPPAGRTFAQVLPELLHAGAEITRAGRPSVKYYLDGAEGGTIWAFDEQEDELTPDYCFTLDDIAASDWSVVV